MKTAERSEIYHSLNLGPATFFDQETFGTEHARTAKPSTGSVS
jgi:hypothetical protein